MLSDPIHCTLYDTTLLHAPFIFEQNRRELLTLNSEIKDTLKTLYENYSINGILDNGVNLSYISEPALQKLESVKQLNIK